MHFYCINPFKAIGGHFDTEKIKINYIWIEPVKAIAHIMLKAKPISQVLWKIKFNDIAFEDFKKSLKELE